MQTLIGLGYYLIAGLCLIGIGAIGHVIRAKFNLVPDLLFRRNGLNLLFSSGYNLQDMIFGTEYDDAGYYRFDSAKNFRIAVISALVMGWGLMLLSTEAALVVAGMIDAVGAWLWQLLVLRIADARLW